MAKRSKQRPTDTPIETHDTASISSLDSNAQAPNKSLDKNVIYSYDALLARAYKGHEQTKKQTLEKHAEELRFKVAYTAHRIADDLSIEVSKKNKKDKEYIKGLVWSLGVLFDKLATATGDAVTVRIPSKLLDNVKAVIAVQIEKRAAKEGAKDAPIDITPVVVDSESSILPAKSST